MQAFWFNLLKILFFLTILELLPLAIVAKQYHFPCYKLILFMLYSFFCLYMKEPFTYFRIVLTSLLYYGNAFCFWSKSGKLFPTNDLKASLEIRRIKHTWIKIAVRILRNQLTENIAQIFFTMSHFWFFSQTNYS